MFLGQLIGIGPLPNHISDAKKYQQAFLAPLSVKA